MSWRQRHDVAKPYLLSRVIKRVSQVVNIAAQTVIHRLIANHGRTLLQNRAPYGAVHHMCRGPFLIVGLKTGISLWSR